MSNIAIKAENISKYYRLGQINNGTLYADIQSWFARKLGKEDPHAKIVFDSAQSDKDDFWALKDINFEIKQGDRVGIIGRNGAGKSTLLKVISEITTPTTGNIYIKGRVASLLEVGTGFHPEMTGRENIYMNGAILGMKRAEITRQLDEIIDFAEIEKYIDTPVKRYSSGMYVRLAFAVAAHLQSEILIADEVLAVGDAAFQKKAIGKMNDLSTGEGRTVLFVSHNMAQVKMLCENGIVLDKGKIKQISTIDEAISYYLSEMISISQTSFKVFQEDNKKDFQLKSVHIIDENGNNQQQFESQCPIVIKLNCISRKPISGLYGYFQIIDSLQRSVIVFDSTEQERDMMTDLSVGEHTFLIKIPAGILSSGTYSFYANFTSQLNISGFTIDSPMHCCSFEVIDTITKRGNNRGAVTGFIPQMIEV